MAVVPTCTLFLCFYIFSTTPNPTSSSFFQNVFVLVIHIGPSGPYFVCKNKKINYVLTFEYLNVLFSCNHLHLSVVHYFYDRVHRRTRDTFSRDTPFFYKKSDGKK